MITMPTEDECLRRVNAFIREHPTYLYDEEIKGIARIRNHIEKASNPLEIPDVLRQIYVKTGICRPEDNPYESFVELIQQKVGLEEDFIDIAGGPLPILGNTIALRQQKGTIEVRDPRVFLLPGMSEKLKVTRSSFQCGGEIPQNKTIIGFMPGISAYSIIETAAKSGRNFIMVVGDMIEPYLEPAECEAYKWALTQYHLPEYMGEVGVTYLPQDVNQKYPVVYNTQKVKIKQ